VFNLAFLNWCLLDNIFWDHLENPLDDWMILKDDTCFIRSTTLACSLGLTVFHPFPSHASQPVPSYFFYDVALAFGALLSLFHGLRDRYTTEMCDKSTTSSYLKWMFSIL
jgi:hypothetical protein